MSLGRLALAALAAAGIAAAPLSCTAVIGGLGDGDYVDAAAKMCSCGVASFAGTGTACTDYLRGRFEGMTDAQRQTWLEVFATDCKTCDTIADCFYREPVCKKLGCTVSGECCNHPTGGVCNAGKCELP